MAPSDKQEPTEHEDFDVTADNNESTKVVVNVAETTESESVIEPTTPVAEAEPEATEPQMAPEEPASPEAVQQTTSEPAASPEPSPEPIVAPSQQKPKQPAATLSSSRSSKGRLVLEAFLIILVIGLGLWSWTLYTDKNNLQDQVATLKANPQLTVKQQSDELINRVSALRDLPKNETPTIASVSDVSAAKKQSAFFNNAQNGDRVLMYVKAGQAILYRPSTNKIILVAPLTFNSSSATSSTATTPAN